MGERYRGWQALPDSFQVSLRGAKLLDKPLGVSLRAGLVCFAYFVLGVIAESGGRLVQVGYLVLETLEQLEHLGQVLRRPRLLGRGADNHVAPGDMAATSIFPIRAPLPSEKAVLSESRSAIDIPLLAISRALTRASAAIVTPAVT